MAHAVVIRVKVDPDSDVEHRHSVLNDYVFPEARALPGYQKGMWMNDVQAPALASSFSILSRTHSQRLRR